MAAAAQVGGGEGGREGGRGKKKEEFNRDFSFRHVLQLLRHILSSPVAVSL